jgi:hypothetical protein
MSTPDFLNADRWIKLAFRNFVVILCILLFVSLAAHASFGPFLILGAFAYIALRIWTVVRPERAARRQQRNTAGAERTPVLPGEAHR